MTEFDPSIDLQKLYQENLWLKAELAAQIDTNNRLADSLEEERAKVRKLEAEVLKLTDDPNSDATDFAHPAWWRGYDNGTASSVQVVKKLKAENRKLEFQVQGLRYALKKQKELWAMVLPELFSIDNKYFQVPFGAVHKPIEAIDRALSRSDAQWADLAAAKESKLDAYNRVLWNAVADAVDTIHGETLNERQGCFRLLDDFHTQELVDRLLVVLENPDGAIKLEQAKEKIVEAAVEYYELPDSAEAIVAIYEAVDEYQKLKEGEI